MKRRLDTTSGITFNPTAGLPLTLGVSAMAITLGPLSQNAEAAFAFPFFCH